MLAVCSEVGNACRTNNHLVHLRERAQLVSVNVEQIVMSSLTGLIEKWESSALELREAEQLINLLIVDNNRLDREQENIITERDYWEEKAIELADDIGTALGFEVGEHSNINCPVQNAIDNVCRMRSQIDEWRSS